MEAKFFTTAGNGTVTEYVKPDAIVLPKFGQWPTYYPPKWLRNGREAGAWLSGIITCIPEKCAHVVIPEDWIAGASHAMIEGGLQVKAYSSVRERDEHTLEVRSIHHEFVEHAD